MLLRQPIAYIKVALSNMKNGFLFIYIKRQRKRKKPVVQMI